MAESAYTSPTTRPLYRGVQVVWYLLTLLEILLLFRFGLKLTGANPYAGFTQFIYALSYPFMAPFLYVFNVTAVNGKVFEWTALLAMFVYWVVAWIIARLLVMGRDVSTHEAATRLKKEDPT